MSNNNSPERISLRRATGDDADRLLSWRNDPGSRAASRDNTVLDREAHVRWLEATLQSSHRKLWIVEVGGEPAGTVRWDQLADGVWELSWTVAPSFRGCGIGKAMVRRAVAETPPQSLVIAQARRDNIASQRIATHAGFALQWEHGDWQYYYFVRTS